MNSCVSCGMPMRNDAEHAMGDATKSHCRLCAREDGTLKSYDEVLAGMSAFLCRTQGLDETVARNMAKDMMAKLPAWR